MERGVLHGGREGGLHWGCMDRWVFVMESLAAWVGWWALWDKGDCTAFFGVGCGVLLVVLWSHPAALLSGCCCLLFVCLHCVARYTDRGYPFCFLLFWLALLRAGELNGFIKPSRRERCGLCDSCLPAYSHPTSLVWAGHIQFVLGDTPRGKIGGPVRSGRGSPRKSQHVRHLRAHCAVV